MTEGVSEDNVASLVYEVTCFFIAIVRFGNILLEYNLIFLESELFSSGLDTVDEVEVEVELDIVAEYVLTDEIRLDI